MPTPSRNSFPFVLSEAMTVREEEIYQEHVLDHCEDPYHRGSCARATHAHEDDNPLCGDNIRIELQITDDGHIADAWFSGEGCCISQASASMLMEAIEGKTVQQVKEFAAEDMLELFGPRLTPNRQKCCLLSWRVLQSAVYSPINGMANESRSADHSRL
jgi:nitrogen fixation NifU-like protein